MDREYLLHTAGDIPQVGEKQAKEYSTKMDFLVGLINKKMEARADILEMVGSNNLDMMKDNHANHARFMESVFYAYKPEVLVDTVIWVFRAYRSRNFSSTYWAAQLNSWIEIYKEELSADCSEAILPYYKWLQVNIPVFNKLAEENPEPTGSAH